MTTLAIILLIFILLGIILATLSYISDNTDLGMLSIIIIIVFSLSVAIIPRHLLVKTTLKSKTVTFQIEFPVECSVEEQNDFLLYYFEQIDGLKCDNPLLEYGMGECKITNLKIK